MANVRSLIAGLKMLGKELRHDVPVDIEQSTCALLAGEVRANVAAIDNVDGNYAGADADAVNVEVGWRGHEVVWRGAQITYLEFGTGAKGAGDPYKGGAMAKTGYYRPDPQKDHWAYLDAIRGPRVSHGLGPQAPMFNASLLLRAPGTILGPARAVVNKVVARAITV